MSKVLQFLQHDGYIDTARAFAEEVQAEKQHLSLDPNEIIEGINITDDEDASKRQRECFPVLFTCWSRSSSHSQ